MWDAIVVGSATEDVFVVVPEAAIIRVQQEGEEQAYLAVEHGAKVGVRQLEIMIGGCAPNVSTGLARMGLRTAAVCKVGRDLCGDRVLSQLRQQGVDTSLCLRSADFATGYSVILTCFTGERTVLVHRGANEHLSFAELDQQKLAQTQWLYVGAFSGPAMALFFELAEFAGQHGLKLAVNPGGAQLRLGVAGLKPALQHVTVMFINQPEAYQLTGVAPSPSRADEHRMLRLLHEAGCRMVVITAGDQGSYGYDGSGYYFVPAYQVKVASTLGAGDSFAAGCLAALHYGCQLPEAMQIGAANAAHVVQHIGATSGLLSWPAAQDFVAAHRSPTQ
jgi:sugar/nucleoside kinase (ribokinase family)